MRSMMLALAALSVPTAASAQLGKACLTRGEAESLITFVLPSVIRGLKMRCESVLSATAPLVEAGAIVAARYQPDADKAWPAARPAFDKIAGFSISASLGEAAARRMIEPSLTAGLSQTIKLADCPKIDRLIDILQPLPSKNMAQLVLVLMELAGQSKSGLPFTVCAPPVAR